jgi:TetR/AcrR family transcriptional regulator, transcriptional repressor for nem operon
MGYSQAQKAESRARVLDVAARKIREDGIDSLGVADCMRAAGLTHGAFYAHFESRDALIVAALESAIAEGDGRIETSIRDAEKNGKSPLEAVASSYLSERHLNNPGKGCALCSLAGEARHSNDAIKGLFSRYTQMLAARIAEAAGIEDEERGLALIATVVGAITLARSVDDDALAKQILSGSLALVLSQDKRRKPTSAPAQ